MELKRIIQYSDLYPEEADNLPQAKDFVKGLRREDLCTITANMVQRLSKMPFFDNNLDPGKGEYDFVRFFLSGRIPEFTQDVINRHAIAKKKLPSTFENKFYATSKSAIMSFQRLFFSVKPEKELDAGVQVERNYFKA